MGANAWAAEGDNIYSNDFSTKDYSDFATWLGTGKQPSGYSYAQLGRCGTFSIVDEAWVINAQTSKNNSQVDNGNYGTLIEGITTATSTTNYVLEFDITLAVLNHYAGNAIFEISGEDNKTILCLYAKHTRSSSTAGSTSYGYIVGGNNAFSTKEATYTTRTNTEGSWGDGTQNDIATVSGTTGSKTYHIILDAQTNGLAKLTIKEGESKVVDEADVNISANKGIKYLYMSTRNYDDSYITPVSVNSITIDNLSIVEGAASTAATADYTVKFVTTINDAETEIKSSDTRTGIVNSSISLTNADKNTIWYENKKYIYSSDNASSSTIANDNSTVVKVMFAEAPSYTYSVVDNLGNTLSSGSSYQGEDVDFYVPYYAFKDGKFYSNPNLSSGTLSYGKSTITAIADNTNITVTYTEEENSNVVFFSEAENLTGIKAFSDNYTKIRMSNGQGGYYESQTAFVTLPAGVYTLTSATRQGKTYFYSGTVGEGIEIGTVESSGSVVTTTSQPFTLTKQTDIYTSVGSTSAYFDYVIIRRTGDAPVPVSGLADGEYVYTPQGRFQVMGDLVAHSYFNDFSGWEVITATDGKTVMDNFVIDPDGPAAGVFYAVSLDNTAGEGMYFKFTPTDAGATYVVSYKMKGAQAVTTRVKTVAVSTNLVKVEGNSDGVYGGTNDVLLCNTAEELSDEWQTFNYAIVGDGVPRTYFISFSGMADNIYIADLQIAEAVQVADLRARDAAIERVNVYKNAYAWSEEDLNDYGIYDALEILNAIGDQSSQAALNDALEAANEMLNEFRYSNMDDYLAGGDERNYLSNTFEVAGDSEASSYGVWNCIPSGRGHWAANAYPDMGHYQNGTTWNNGAPTTAQGVTTQMELTPGAYVFAIKSAAALREPLEQTWHTDDGMKPAYGIAYIAKVNGETVDIIASSEQKDLEPVKMTPFYVTANITEAGKYEFGMLAYCKEAYQSLNLGSVTYVGDASIVGKSYSKYTQKQLAYEEDVREQITTGREQLTIAAANLADEEKLWGKDELQACVNTVSPRIAAYETLTQDDIIATYADYYEKTISNDNGIMVYEIYQEAVKAILAANRRFNAVNSVVPVTITSAGWATLYTPYAIDFSTVEGLEAYTATVSENTVTLSKVNNVPAGTGVVLKGEAKDYNIPVTANSETEKGSLEGSATEATAYDKFSGYKLYMLKKVGDNVQFVPMTSGSLAKGKAYLKIAQDNAGSGEAKALSVVFVNEPTGIKSVNSDETKVNGIYDLQGRRVSQPTKGLYIVNGKKVVIK